MSIDKCRLTPEAIVIQRRALLRFCVSGLSISACGGPTFIVQQYDGAPRPPEAVAILRFQGDEAVQLVTLDGARADAALEEDVRLHVEVLPGAHTLSVADKRRPELGVHRLAFRARGGGVYRVVLAQNPGVNTKARIYEVDRDSNALLEDVTLEVHDRGETRALPAP